MRIEDRIQAIMALSRFTGVNVTSQFLRNTGEHFSQAGISRVHNLVEGIYKPASDKYAFCVWSKSAAGADQEVYRDLFQPQDDGSWTMMYAAKEGSFDSASNRALFACLKDKIPVMVIMTSRSHSHPEGARYKILGPAMIEDFDVKSRRFMLRGCSVIISQQIEKHQSAYDVALYALRNCLIMPFQLKEARSKYQINKEDREKAFRMIILEEYRCQCAVCQSKFLLKQNGDEAIIEAEAGHIIPVQDHGPDDPRNGLSLCRRHHWAFDMGLFTITDSQAVKLSPAVLRAERRRFDLEEYDGETLVGPASEPCRPAEQALHWHQKRKFKRV
jgi:predicted restriction endonuclease